MPSIGETLREARMRQRLDIADVEARTKIRAKYLRALENEEFAMLPGSTFVKTFLRTYAEQLGLDAHRLVEEYRANYEAEDEPEQAPLGPPAVVRRERERRRSPRSPRSPRPPRIGPPNRLTIVGGFIVALLALFIILGVTGGDDKGDKGSTKQAATTPSETTTTTPARKKAAKKKAKKPNPAVATAVNLRITPEGPTYVCLDRGEGTDKLFEGTLTAPQTFTGKRVRLNLGRTAVAIRLNGKPFKVVESSSPVGYEFSPRGGKSLPSGQRPCA